MAILTIFTPAYNRAHTIGRTYDSLCRQTCKDFEWLVVDDGSVDNTRELVEGWIHENKIHIRYIYQENQGMHGAHNTAYKNITTELNTCIDSDDYMPDDAVEKIVRFWTANGSDEYAGLVGLDVNIQGNIIGTEFSKDIQDTTLMGFYENGGKGDKKLVYRTSIIKSVPEYPIFKGEKYVGLAYKYMLIDQQYKLLVMNEPLVIVDYQLDGSSYSMYKQYWKNPKGFAFFRRTEMVCSKNIQRRFIINVHYVSSSIISKNIHFLRESPCKLLTILAIPFGVLLSMVICYKALSNKKYKI